MMQRETIERVQEAASLVLARTQGQMELPIEYVGGAPRISDPGEIRECCEVLDPNWAARPGSLHYHLCSMRHVANLFGVSYDALRYEVARRSAGL